MKFSDFLFPESQKPEGDYTIIDQALQGAELCGRLRYETVWLAGRHFDGGCA